jgi:hypothetical protein
MKIIIIALCVIALVSCKKKETTAAPSSSTGTTTSGTSSNYGGEFNTLIRNYSIGGVTSPQDSLAYCYFVNYATNPGSKVYAGNVSYNGTQFFYDSSDYQDSTFVLNLHQPNAVWNIAGSANVQAFNFTHTPSYPKFTGNSLLPDSVSISSGITINLGSSISNATDSITITIGFNAIKKIGANQNTCYFSPTDLMYLSLGNGFTIELEMVRKQIVTHNGKDYYLFNRLTHIKSGIKIKS